jgi:hypothetical protein
MQSVAKKQKMTHYFVGYKDLISRGEKRYANCKEHRTRTFQFFKTYINYVQIILKIKNSYFN